MIAATGIDRVAGALAAAKTARGGALIPYLCAGDPDLATTERLMLELGAAGADVIELGIPYGDPLADGPTIAASAQRALNRGATTVGALAAAGRAIAAGAPPVLAFTYVNPVVQYGNERFADALVTHGFAGALVPDIPLEETETLRALFAARGLVLPLLVAPTTPPERAATIARASSGFTYLVSRLGVTAATVEPVFGPLRSRVAALRAVSELPLAVGFGIATPEQVARACDLADAAIVGSALIDAYTVPGGDPVELAGAFVRRLATGLPGRR